MKNIDSQSLFSAVEFFFFGHKANNWELTDLIMCYSIIVSQIFQIVFDYHKISIILSVFKNAETVNKYDRYLIPLSKNGYQYLK